MPRVIRLRLSVHVTGGIRFLRSTPGPLNHTQSLQLASFNRSFRAYSQSTNLQQDGRSRLSTLWAPSGGIATNRDEDGHSRLMRAGFLRQGHSGIFHLLPLGRRVQEKIERLIDKHMSSLGASRLDLSSISSEELWKKSGRLRNANSELFRFRDRGNTGYLLSPTHEEEITFLVANTIRSYKELPTRLYQISRKYRDELRPRHGLLRSREFVMKDLYTFDCNTSLALSTYNKVCEAYVALFNELKIRFLVAEADPGDMGGNLSHEFHFPTPKGEDHVISCTNCGYVANEEVARSYLSRVESHCENAWKFVPPDQISANSSLDRCFSVWRGLSRGRETLINVWYALASPRMVELPNETMLPEINTHAVKAVISELDPGVEDASATWTRMAHGVASTRGAGAALDITPNIVNLVDYRLPTSVADAIRSEDQNIPLQPETTNQSTIKITSSVLVVEPSSNEPLNLTRIRNGDTCSRCDEGQLRVEKAIELGHTFFLGSRYSKPLNALVSLPMLETGSQNSHQDAKSRKSQFQENSRSTEVPMQMGCYGIGVSRMIGAVAEILSDNKGLNWPRVIAPYDLAIIPIRENELDAISVYDALSSTFQGAEETSHMGLDIILDDRECSFAWKIRDADLVGYPVIVVIGKRWKIDRTCEVQSRRLSVCKNVPLDNLATFITNLLIQL